mmetsp:Transcript_7399/g.30793  ORF Transcript_7399/g.30793 Transcript_7399/m.30793 type:complete len:212 (+) Transcript_7399:171-806(+)
MAPAPKVFCLRSPWPPPATPLSPPASRGRYRRKSPLAYARSSTGPSGTRSLPFPSRTNPPWCSNGSTTFDRALDSSAETPSLNGVKRSRRVRCFSASASAVSPRTPFSFSSPSRTRTSAFPEVAPSPNARVVSARKETSRTGESEVGFGFGSVSPLKSSRERLASGTRSAGNRNRDTTSLRSTLNRPVGRERNAERRAAAPSPASRSDARE